MLAEAEIKSCFEETITGHWTMKNMDSVLK